MLQLTIEFKNKVLEALLAQRENFSGSDAAFAKQWSMNGAVFSQLKNGHVEKHLLKDTQWLTMGREFGINLNERKWNVARTEVFEMIEEDIVFCQEFSKARICVDESEIGKTFTAKYLARTRTNCFYVDASQAKTKQLFIRLMAKTIGIDHTGKYAEVKENIKYYLKMLPKPLLIIDEAGDLEYKAFLELKEFWNATEGACGWYMIGADGLKAMFEKGIRGRKVGYKELFSRFSSNYTRITPIGKDDRQEFYRNLIRQVLEVNAAKPAEINTIIKKCLVKDASDQFGGLRRAESLLILEAA